MEILWRSFSVFSWLCVVLKIFFLSTLGGTVTSGSGEHRGTAGDSMQAWTGLEYGLREIESNPDMAVGRY